MKKVEIYNKLEEIEIILKKYNNSVLAYILIKELMSNINWLEEDDE